MYDPESNSRRYRFFIEQDGLQYECERIVTGRRILQQMVHVFGVGSYEDAADYGPQHHPPETMQGAAWLIAHEIIHHH